MNVESESEGIGGASPGRFRTAALVAILAGGTGSVGLTFYSGQSTDERLLVVLIAIWVLSPFAVLLLAHRFSARWSNSMRRTLHGVATVVGFGSVALYAADASGLITTQGAFIFVAVPLGSWLLLLVAVPITVVASGWRSRRSEE